MPDRISRWQIIYKILARLALFKVRLFFAGCALIAVVFLMLNIGGLARDFVDHAGSNIQVVEILVCGVLFGFASFWRSYLINTISEFTALIIKKEAYLSLISSSCSQVESESFSEQAIIINSDSDQIAKLITDLFSFLVRNIIMGVGSIILMLALSVKLSLGVLMIIISLSCFAKIFDQKIRALIKDVELAKANNSNFVTESIINHKIIHIFNTQNNMSNFFNQLAKDYEITLTKRIKLRALFFASIVSLMLIFTSLLVWYGTLEELKGNMTSGDLVSFFFYAGLGMMSFGGIIELLSNLDKTFASCQRIFSIIENQGGKISQDQEKLELSGYLDLNSIEYKYSTGLDAGGLIHLGPFNFRILFGKFNVLVGPSGSGKTTILNLLMGVYKPYSGKFLNNNIAIKNLNQNTSNVSYLYYVPQDSMLFGASIKDNISFFEENPDIDFIKQILLGLGLEEFLDSLSLGIETNIGSLATKISGGQKQRIAIARALYQKPEILILDEATSQLDKDNENKVLDYLLEFMKDKTIIASAHRQNMIERADIVIDILDKKLE
ncbi:MAG: ABC transporter ATP-binding protein [Rickettsiaceae bacterium]|nr:ABC transporter ATP-binding protein [Rickettsiaceae bacterium]